MKTTEIQDWFPHLDGKQVELRRGNVRATATACDFTHSLMCESDLFSNENGLPVMLYLSPKSIDRIAPSLSGPTIIYLKD